MYIVADIGGTKTRIAGSRDREHFDVPIILDTPQTYEEGLAVFVESVKKIASGETIEGIAIGLPGILSHGKRALFNAPHLPQWNGQPLADRLEADLHTRVYLENDTALVGLGEAVFGAGQGSSILMYLTVSTGIGGVRIVDGEIDRATFGFEIGHQYLSPSSDEVTWEDLLSGSAIEKKYGKHPRDLGGDSPVWEELAIITAFGVHNATLHWSPDRVVLGGSMFKEVGIQVDRVQFHLKRIAKILPELPQIVHSDLGDLGGLWGGLARLKRLG